MLNTKIKVISIFSFLLLIIITLFLSFYKMQTFFKGILIQYNSSQIIQVGKTNETDFYNNKTIYIKEANTTYKTYVQSYNEDANFYYLCLAKYFYEPENIKNVWVYNKKVSLAQYVINTIFDF